MPRIIDAHIHYGDDAPQLLALLDELDVMLLNISLVPDPAEDWRAQADHYADLHRRFPKHFAWCTTIFLPNFDDPKYAERAILA